MLPKEPYKKFAAVTLYVAVALAAIYIIFNYLWGAILPFLIAYIFAECFKPVVRYSEQHHRFPKRIFVLFVVFLAAGSLGALIFAISRQTVLEIRTLFLSVKEIITKLAQDDNYASELIKSISDSLPFGDITPKLWEFRENLDTNLWDMALSLGDKFSGTALSLLGNAALFIPELILNTVVVIIATYYFAVDRVKVNCFFLSFFPRNGRLVLKYIKDILSNTVGQYIKAYGLLFFLTFGELLLSFSLLRLKYSFILALVIAFVDLLPVLGTGTVLIPWGIICLVTQNYYLGVWLLIVYAVITVIRQIIEPKIVGKMFGLHPLAALAAMYIGLRLMGLLGIFIFGIGAIIISRVIDLRDEVRKENEKNAGI
ncbi:MAG: sporulation integral membrane protein YtvI [Clostridia bacterium]|nr:sporulation integral membrane protein YtvI [Clostridia bacterium]